MYQYYCVCYVLGVIALYIVWSLKIHREYSYVLIYRAYSYVHIIQGI